MYIFLGILLILLIIFIIYLFLIMPNLSARSRMSFLENKNIAHRGLHNISEGIPENSLLAAKLAVDARYPIELDVRLTKDNQVVVFHDDNLNRVTNGEGPVENYTLLELQSLSLEGTNHTIPTFLDFLKEVDGAVPIVIEVKDNFNNPLLCEKTSSELENYTGEYIVQSFQPDIILWFKKNRPEILRGQLATWPAKGKINPVLRLLSSHMILNFLTKPHFISYDLRYANNPAFRISKRLGCFTLIWTVRTPEEFEKAKKLGVDGIIFENIVPAIGFKKPIGEVSRQKKQAVVSITDSKTKD